MAKNRDPLQVSPSFKKRLEELQVKIMKQKGKKYSYVDITEDMSKNKFFEDFEKSILSNNFDIDLKIKFDRRIR